MDELDDCLRRAQAGDPDAYGPVVAAHQARLRGFIAGYVPAGAWVDDLAQQTFVSAYRDLRKFMVGSDFYAWLRQIAYNHLRAELDKSKRRSRLLDLAAAELSRRLQRDADPSDDLDALRDCVGRLPETSQKIVHRHYRDGAPLAEIAAALGRPANSLKVTLFRIRTQLRACVEKKRVELST